MRRRASSESPSCAVCEARVREALRRLRAWAWPSLIQALDDPAFLEDWRLYDAARAAQAACPHGKAAQG